MLDTNDALSERSRGRRTHGSRAGAETKEEEQNSSRAGAETRGAQQDGSSAGTASPEPGTTCTTCTAARTASPTAAQPETTATASPTTTTAALRSAYGSWSSPRGRAGEAETDGRTEGEDRTRNRSPVASAAARRARLRALHALRGLDDRSSAAETRKRPEKQFCTLRDCRTRRPRVDIRAFFHAPETRGASTF